MGTRRRARAGGAPPGLQGQSNLVTAFSGDIGSAADAVVLRGYLGRSTIVERILEFLDIALRTGSPKAEIEAVRTGVIALAKEAEEHYPRRVYLTPRLDRYVDFHPSCCVCAEPETQPGREDAVTVWLRPLDDHRIPIPYRLVQETKIGPSYAAYLGGQLVDDYLEQSGPTNTAWGEQAGWGVAKKRTTLTCGE
jgi:hypothetical protein